ncbi:MAG: carboxypeptidase-like regulatory domain-containing protein, partial [Planctomycetota bacterium]
SASRLSYQDAAECALALAMDVSPEPPDFRQDLLGPWSKFLGSDEGKSYVRNHITVSADGLFRIEGLPAAEYQFSVKAFGEAAISKTRPAGPLLSGRGSFIVSGVVSQEPVEEIDLGVIDLQSHVPLKKVADWGRGEAAKNGLLARVIPVLSSMSEDNIDPNQRATKFAKPDDVAFVVELENISDKPIQLLDTRYGASYGEAKGKANSNWFGQFLFSFDLFDQNGKRIERPEVQVVSQDMILDGTLVVPLAPGATHRFLLRPAEWLRPFTLPLEHGRYGIAIRYHGMPDRVATRIKEYRPDSPTLQAVGGDVVSGVVQIDVAGEKKTGSPTDALNEETTGIDGEKSKSLHPQLVWGAPSNGLRAAMSFFPHRSTHAHGDKPKLNLHVQNVIDKPIIFATELWLSELSASVKDDRGESVTVGTAWYSGMTPTARVTLKPQQILKLDAGNIGFAITKERSEKFEHITNRTLVAPAGKYSLQLGGRFGDSFLLKDSKDKVLAPLEGDYIGELKTGATPFEVTHETIDCEIIDAVTGKPVAGTLVNFRFFKPKSGEKPEEIVSDMFWGPKSPSRIYFAIPEEVLKRTDREDIEFQWSVSGHPDYEYLAPAERIKLQPFFRDGTKEVREKLKQIKLTPKKVINAGPGIGPRTAAARYRGTVIGPDGRPFKGASVFLLPFSLKANSIGTVRAESNAEGRFEFDAPDMAYVDDQGHFQRKQGLVIASAEGFASDWSKTAGHRVGGLQAIPIEEASIELRLAKDDVPIHGRFLAPDGRPLAGARVQIVEVMIPLQQDLDAHLDWEMKASLLNSIAYARSFYLPHLLPGLKAEARTDNEGNFKLSGIGRDRLVRLKVSGPTIVDTELEVMTRESPDVRIRLGDPTLPTEVVSMIHGAGFTLGLKPGRTVKGRVIDRETGKPIAGMWVGQRQNAVNEITPGLYPWTTDDVGRFTISGISPSSHDIEIAAVTTPGLPYQSASAMADGQDEITIQCLRGIPFLLKVVDQHNQPVSAEVWYTDIQPNPYIAKQRDEFRWPVNTAGNLGDGNYRGFVLPGPGAVLVRLPQEMRYRPARVNPKAFFSPGRSTDDTSQFGTLDDLVISRGVYRDTIYRGDRIAQKEFASIVLVNPPINSAQLELVATVTIDLESGPGLR